MTPWQYVFVFLWGYGSGLVAAWMIGGHAVGALIGGCLMAVVALVAIIDGVREGWK